MEKLHNKKPSIRFPEFNDGWEHKILSELLSVSKQLNGDLRYSKDEVLSVSGECGIVNQIEHMGRSYAGESVHNYHVVETGDIVYTKSPLKAYPYGIIKLNKGNSGIVSTLYAVYHVNKKQAVGEFLDYYFSLDANTNRYLRPLVKKGAKNDMKINNSYVLNDRIFVPSLNEQRRIASFFTLIEKKINLLKQKKSLLEQYKKGVMQKIFNREIRFKNDDGNEFPEWEEKTLGEITFKVDKKNKNNEVLPIYSINNIDGFIPQSEQFDGIDSNERGYNISLYKIIDNNTFAYNPARINVGSIGYSGTLGRIIVSSLYVCFKTYEFINDIFFNHYLNTNHFKNSVLRKGEGGVRIYLFYENFSEITISLPCFSEQTKIANFLSAIVEKINLCNKQIEKTEAYKKGLLQQMFV
jgi:type I restriction enzyme S subunit